MEEDVSTDLLERALGNPPFPWQRRLLARFLDGDLPAALDVPTGLGKTAVIGVWLVARAMGAKVPRRLVYVVDRRAVVDQATDEAEQLREVVEESVELKTGLALERRLPISTLRGQHVDNRDWLADPSSPAIILGTVDMIGSRLLFEGYGVSRKMRPYHAGLLGADSLIVLDEAHLVAPFERLIETIASGRDADARDLGPREHVPPLRIMSLSATGRAHGPGALVLGADDRANSVVEKRLTAIKRLVVRDAVEPKALPEALASEAWTLSQSGDRAVRCIVFCDRRDDARKVAELLRARAKKEGKPIENPELFVGGRRLYERAAAATWLRERGFFAGSDARPTLPTFVVATSAGEVGVDLDADQTVMDLVAWERMVQRLGRVNRRGEVHAKVVVVPAPTDERRALVDAARGVIDELPLGPDGARDASPGALVALKARAVEDDALAARIAAASTPPVLHPPLTRAVVEAWSMTSLEVHSGRPEVAPWVRGWVEDEEPQTTIVWRDALPLRDAPDGRKRLLGPTELESFLEGAGAELIEKLETETWRAVEWLAERIDAVSERKADESSDALRRGDVVAVIVEGEREPRELVGASLDKRQRDDLTRELVGAVLIVDARLGGLAAGLLDGTSAEARDVTNIDEARVPVRVSRVTDPAARSGDAKKWRVEARIPVARNEQEETAWLLIESRIAEAAESEEGRSTSARAQGLDEHEEWTEREAERLATRLGLSAAHREVLCAAARLHDEGKKAKRWQRAFGAPESEILAKTTGRPNVRLLDGYRHELGSLPHAEKHERVKALDEPLRELCLHLIAAHHGNARPVIRTDGAEEPPTRLMERAREIALRFARLEKEWGPWGLAWWEAVLRAADQQASRKNDERGE